MRKRKVELEELRSNVHKRLQEIIKSLQTSNYDIDTLTIATSITNDIIKPFFTNNNNVQMMMNTQRQIETHYTIETILSRSSLFVEFQSSLHSLFTLLIALLHLLYLRKHSLYYIHNITPLS